MKSGSIPLRFNFATRTRRNQESDCTSSTAAANPAKASTLANNSANNLATTSASTSASTAKEGARPIPAQASQSGKSSFFHRLANKAGAPAKVYRPREVALTPVARAAICDEVCNTFLGPVVLAFNGIETGESCLRASHYLLGLLMASVYKHHSGGNHELVLSDDDAAELFDTASRMIKSHEYNGNAEKLTHPDLVRFRPAMAKTLEIVYNGFDQVERLKDIDYQYRPQLIVDPVILRRLQCTGLDIGNPFMMFIFDASPTDDESYALDLAPKWIKTMALVGKPFNLATLENIEPFEMHSEIGNLLFPICTTRAGRQRIARFISMAEYVGVRTVVQAGVYSYVQNHGVAERLLPLAYADADDPDRISPSCSSISEIFALEDQMSQSPHGMREGVFQRVTDFPQVLMPQYNKFLRTVVEQIVEQGETIPQDSADEATRKIARLCLDCKFMVPKVNRNYRFFCLLTMNLLLANAGLPLAVLDDPLFSLGSSYDEFAGRMQDAMETARSWKKQPALA
ncbi:MAG: hypothetical protein ACRYGK_09275 [Janthinobacterium lividum]